MRNKFLRTIGQMMIDTVAIQSAPGIHLDTSRAAVMVGPDPCWVELVVGPLLSNLEYCVLTGSMFLMYVIVFVLFISVFPNGQNPIFEYRVPRRICREIS
jgi:hypothetical protein